MLFLSRLVYNCNKESNHNFFTCKKYIVEGILDRYVCGTST